MKTQTTAEAPPGLPRRAFLTGLAIAVPLAATLATPALAAPGASRSEIDKLYEERTELAVRSRELSEQYQAAEASMPWWARSGHEYVREDGTWAGAFVGWPAIDDDKLPTYQGSMLKKRISPLDIRRNFESNARLWKALDTYRYDGCGRDKARAVYRQAMRDLVARLRRQREEEQKVGLPGLIAQMDATSDRIEEIDDRLEHLDVLPAAVPQKAAALLLIASIYDHHRNDSFGISTALEALRPFLTGQIREHADHVAVNPSDEMWTMPFWPG